MDRSDRQRRRRRRAQLALSLLGALLIAIAVVVSTGQSPRVHRAPATEPSVPAPSTTPALPAPATTPAPAPIGPAAQAPPATAQFGASVNLVFNALTYPQPHINAQLQALHQTGATIARTDAYWEAAEPNAPVNGIHHYDWTFADTVAGSLAAHGLRWLPIIDYSALWAESVPGQDHSPPRSASDYAAYAAAFAARYGPGGSFWRSHPDLPAEPVETYEIWNEPDIAAFWSPSPDPSRYVELYLRARDAITSVDPTARVIIGGLVRADVSLPAMLQARPDLRRHLDGVAIHPYRANPLGLLAVVRADRQLLRSLGLATVPLYLTEFGWSTHPAGASKWAPEQLRPRYIETTFAALGHLDCGIAAAVLYTWRSPERDPSNVEDWFGIDSRSGVGTADTRAFAAGLHRATAAGPPLRLCGAG